MKLIEPVMEYAQQIMVGMIQIRHYFNLIWKCLGGDTSAILLCQANAAKDMQRRC